MDRLSVLHILEDDPQEIDLFSGRITSEKLDMVFANWISLPKIACAFICGPRTDDDVNCRAPFPSWDATRKNKVRVI